MEKGYFNEGTFNDEYYQKFEMKRIIYISKVTIPISSEEIESIGIVSSRNNSRINITGILVYFDKMFFQIIEGDDKKVDQLYEKIGNDQRHHDVLRLKTEYNIIERLFPKWSMKTINLDNDVDELVRPIKILLQSVIESHSIIEQYTQPTVLKILNNGVNPLTVKPITLKRVILFADIISYTRISEKMTLEGTLLILNTYFEICSRIILKNDGEVNKFMGDGLMAYFDESNADNGIHSCLEILQELKTVRKNAAKNSPLKFLNSSFGLSLGNVIEGNMGSKYKTDYTIIGDAVNVSARLESMTREFNCLLVLSDSLRQGTKEPWIFKSLGKYSLKGKQGLDEVFSIDHELVNSHKDDIFVDK